MATRTVFSDENDNELDCYINTKGQLYISISQSGEDAPYGGYITLGKSDTQTLIKLLQDLEKNIEE